MNNFKYGFRLFISFLSILGGYCYADSRENNQMGGYGELHYNNVSSTGENGDESIDFHRFVLFFGHEFSEDIHFFSEVELEHSIAGEDEKGEV
ncbi:MAG: hypothetical protein JKY01_13340, partial [Pseudomonadales bacterium]|nr:hypothetical protein [Pseudomonadales bacterium]